MEARGLRVQRGNQDQSVLKECKEGRDHKGLQVLAVQQDHRVLQGLQDLKAQRVLPVLTAN